MMFRVRNYNISLFILATKSMCQIKWWTDSKVALPFAVHHTKYGSRLKVKPKVRSLVSLDS